MDGRPWGGYVAATGGGLTGGLLLSVTAGGATGAMVEQWGDAHVGMANLALLLVAVAAAAAGAVVGVGIGTTVGLRLAGHPRAVATGAAAAAFAALLVLVCPLASSLPVLLLPAMPALARRAVRPRMAPTEAPGQCDGGGTHDTGGYESHQEPR